MKRLVFIVGSCIGLVASAPLPWRVRMAMARAMERSLRLLLRVFPELYAFIIQQNRRHQMGKQHQGEMQSIMAPELLMREAERRNLSADLVKQALAEAKARGIGPVELPGFLGERLLGADAHRFVRDIVAF
jgi:hypothetical protein